MDSPQESEAEEMRQHSLASRVLMALRRTHSVGVMNDETGIIVIDTKQVVKDTKDKFNAFFFFLLVAAHEWAHAMGKTKESDADQFEQNFEDFLRAILPHFETDVEGILGENDSK